MNYGRVPKLPRSGFEPGTFRIEGEGLIHYSIEVAILMTVLKDKVYTQQSLRDHPRDQGHILSRLTFLKYLNYWKIPGLRPAIFSGTPRNFEA